MNKILSLSIPFLYAVLGVQAQTYTDHLQQSKAGFGKVTITQDKAITDLVNGKNAVGARQDVKRGNATQQAAKNTTAEQARQRQAKADSLREKAAKDKAREALREEERVREANAAAERAKAAERQKAEEQRRAEEARKNRERAADTAKDKQDDKLNIPTIDMRKKVMRNSRKVSGYRVQAFAGGNTRADKQKAQKAGNTIKMAYPDQPIYVHFYSPRWICRVGNYRSYQEAQQMLQRVKALGFKAATIVKGKITVFD